MAENRIATLKRDTKETQIEASLNVDGIGDGKIDTGVPFFDHMLTLFSAHGLFDIDISAKGDVDVGLSSHCGGCWHRIGSAIQRCFG